LVRYLQVRYSLSLLLCQPPTYGDCDGILAWHIHEGDYGGVTLAGLNVMALGSFTGNIWAGAKAAMGIFIDERDNERQRQALQMIFGGQAGGWPGLFAKLIAEARGIEYAPITFEVADDLSFWRAEIPGKLLLVPRRSAVQRACRESTSKYTIRLAQR
jgi:hypothetical protein